jgi:hypothetical protein
VKIKSNVNLDVFKIIKYIYNDYPSFYYVDFNNLKLSYGAGKYLLKNEFLYSKRKINEYDIKIENLINGISSAEQNCISIEKNIYNYIAMNVKYYDDGNSSYNVIGALINNQAVCEGYSRAFKLICDRFHVPCIFISGMAKDENGIEERHAWNLIRIDSKWFHVDSTWNGIFNSEFPLYFNVSDDFIHKDHRWNDKKFYPECVEAGPFESLFVYVDGISKLNRIISRNISCRNTDIAIKFNKKFDSTNDIMNLLNRYFHKFPNNCVKSYSVVYSKFHNCALIKLKYA